LKNIKRHIFFCIILVLSLSFKSQKAVALPILKEVKYSYLLHVPEDYGKDPYKKWPVIFYLHGRHDCNNDELYSWLLKHTLEKLPFWQESLPFLKTIAVKRISVTPPFRPQPGLAMIP